MDTPYPLQRRLFDLISSVSPNRSSWLRQYMKDHHLTRTPATNRVFGQKAISFDEGLQLMRQYGMPLQQLLTDAPPAPDAVKESDFNATQSGHSAIEDYLSTLSADLERLKGNPDAWLYHQTHEIPIFWLKRSRLLMAVRLYYWFQYITEEQDLLTQPFGLDWLQQPRVTTYLNRCKSLLEAYRQIPGVEFWSDKMLDTLIAQIEQLDRQGQLDTDVMALLKTELHSLTRYLEQVARTGNKSPESGAVKGAPLRVCIWPSVLGANDALVGDTGEDCFLYVGAGPFYVRSGSSRLAGQYLDSIQSNIARADLVPVVEGPDHILIFESLNNKVLAIA
jgi:hypothetical protein